MRFILSFSFILHNYCENTLKAEDNYYLIPQILANSSSSSNHSAVSDTSILLFSMASFSISIDGDAYIRVVWVEVCPSILDTSSSSTPFWYSPQALVLRSICGYNFCGRLGWSLFFFNFHLSHIIVTPTLPKNAGKYLLFTELLCYYKSGSAKPQINSAGGPKNGHK